MYCQYCGTNLPDGVAFCPNCGAPTNSYNQSSNNNGTYSGYNSYQNSNNNSNYNNQQQNYQNWSYQYSNTQQTRPEDKKSIILNIIAFLCPIIGLILWLVWRKERPIRAKSIGIAALVGVAFEIIISAFA